MNRSEFRAAYREARKAIRFYGDMEQARGVKVLSMFNTLDLCPGFDCCRLHGDILHIFGYRFSKVMHEARMHELRVPVRLPA